MLEVAAAVESLGWRVTCTIHADPGVHIARTLVVYGSLYCSISYNPVDFVTLRVSDGAPTIYAVLGHEVGHVVRAYECGSCTNGHGGELFSDKVGGCVLRVLGFGYSGAHKAARFFRGLHGSRTHPPGRERADAIREGYEACE